MSTKNEEDMRGAYVFAREILGWGPGDVHGLADFAGTVIALGREVETLRRELAHFGDKLEESAAAARSQRSKLELENEALRAGRGVVPIVADVSVKASVSTPRASFDGSKDSRDMLEKKYRHSRSSSDGHGLENVWDRAKREDLERFPVSGPRPTECALCGHFDRERCGHWVGHL